MEIIEILINILFGNLEFVSIAILGNLFGKSPKPPTVEQQASVGMYDEIGPFGSATWIKNKGKGPGYTREIKLSEDELARLRMSDDLREKLKMFDIFFRAGNKPYNDFLYEQIENPDYNPTPLVNKIINPEFGRKEGDPVYDDRKYLKGKKIDPMSGGMFEIVQNMAPGLAIQSRFNNMAGLQNQLNYQPMYQPLYGSGGLTGVQHPGTSGSKGLLSGLMQIGKLASGFVNPASALPVPIM